MHPQHDHHHISCIYVYAYILQPTPLSEAALGSKLWPRWLLALCPQMSQKTGGPRVCQTRCPGPSLSLRLKFCTWESHMSMHRMAG